MLPMTISTTATTTPSSSRTSSSGSSRIGATTSVDTDIMLTHDAEGNEEEQQQPSKTQPSPTTKIKVRIFLSMTLVCFTVFNVRQKHLELIGGRLQQVINPSFDTGGRGMPISSASNDHHPPDDDNNNNNEQRIMELTNTTTITTKMMMINDMNNNTILQQKQQPILLTPDEVEILKVRRQAELKWKKQDDAYLWMQHNRKAGGTTLCMNLRMNMYGLFQMTKEQFDIPTKRETCQLVSFCCDCNIKNKYPKESKLVVEIKKALNDAGRNFIEIEGNGVPINMATGDLWKDFVFVTTIRHPLDRIFSSLKADLKFECCMDCTKQEISKFKNKPPKTLDEQASCVAKYIKKERILHDCQQGNYLCHSNYYTRSFSGYDNNKHHHENIVNRMSHAKRNFRRFSCVVLQEQFGETLSCLERIGFYLRSEDKAFNVDGQKSKLTTTTTTTTTASKIDLDAGKEPSDDLYHTLPKEKIQLLIDLNQEDLEFYEWAREQILIANENHRQRQEQLILEIR